MADLKSLEERLSEVLKNRKVFRNVFGHEIVNDAHRADIERINEWDKSDLKAFEEKIILLEKEREKLDAEKLIADKIQLRRSNYKDIDHLLLEAIAEKEKGRPERMVEYLKLRDQIRDKFPIE